MEHIFDRYMKERDPVGVGSYALVFKGLNKNTNKAVILKKSNLIKPSLNEIKILTKIGTHYNIVQLLDYYEEANSIWLILEHCSMGDLQKHCTEFKPSLEFIIDTIHQCALGLDYLHKLKTPVIHRDLKPPNILLHHENDDIVVKICDFGVSKLGEQDSLFEYMLLSKEVGTELYKSPEMFVKGNYTASLDIFSLGLILEAMLHYGLNITDKFLPAIACRPECDHFKAIGDVMSREKTSIAIVSHSSTDTEKQKVIKSLIVGMTKYKYKERHTLEDVITQLRSLQEEELKKPEPTKKTKLGAKFLGKLKKFRKPASEDDYHVNDTLEIGDSKGATECFVVKAKHDYKPGKKQPENLCFKKGDRMRVLDTSENWYFAEHLHGGKKGYIPKEEYVVPDSNDYTTEDWWFDGCTKLQAERYLSQPNVPIGTFIVRPSSEPGYYALALLRKLTDGSNDITHFRIVINQKGRLFIYKATDFNSLEDLVKYYTGQKKSL